jgi:hypothetical protein
MRTVIGLYAALCVGAIALSQASAIAQDAAPEAGGGRFVRPSVEELAIPPAEPATDAGTREAMCLMIESAARSQNLPLEFFARVIWQESRFQSDAVGPPTRHGERAQGIAQFMPGTASERRLLDPFDPVQALPKSAEFLAELRQQFGNLGLAAAAYNAGPRRVQEWLAGSGYMPEQTRNYVLAITGTTVDQWAKAGGNVSMPDRAPTSGCRELMALLRRAPNSFVTELEAHVKLAAAKLWGVQLAAGYDREHGAGDVCPRHQAARLRDRRPGPEPVEFGIAHPGRSYVLSGADRRRHAPGGRRSLQSHPARRRRLLRAEKHHRQVMTGPVADLSRPPGNHRKSQATRLRYRRRISQFAATA